MKRIQGIYTDEEFAEIQEIKNKSGYSWDVFIRKAAECFAKHGENEE